MFKLKCSITEKLEPKYNKEDACLYGVGLLQSFYFNNDNPELVELYKKYDSSESVDHLPIQMFMQLVTLQVFKLMSNKNTRIILNVLENLKIQKRDFKDSCPN